MEQMDAIKQGPGVCYYDVASASNHAVPIMEKQADSEVLESEQQ